MRIEDQLNGVRQCPFCSKPDPSLRRVWASDGHLRRGDGGPSSRWAAYTCLSCGSVLTARGDPSDMSSNAKVIGIYPAARAVHEDIPGLAKHFLQQAIDTLHSPDAAGVMAASAVDAMLKHLNYNDGSLYARINQAVEDRVLTQGMADWAHEVRLGANRPRHADADNPTLSPEEARQAVEFAEALGYFLFVLTAQITRGIEAAGAAE